MQLHKNLYSNFNLIVFDTDTVIHLSRCCHIYYSYCMCLWKCETKGNVIMASKSVIFKIQISM